jgi:alginate O-acetyltransferase complex protein AlgI
VLFSSASYLLFLPISVGLYWVLPRAWRLHFLVVASYVFYATWSVPYAAMMFGLVVFNWGAAVLALRSTVGRNAIIGVAIVFDLAVLALFKYLDFFAESATGLLSTLGQRTEVRTPFDLILPLGISFFTFEFIHYLIEMRRGAVPSRNFSEFHVFAAFFPTQIAGPIKRFQDFLPQIKLIDRLSSELIVMGVSLIIRGLFKKMALGDNLARIVDRVIDDPAALTALDAWGVLLAFAFQIYFDFSGYTDIARGSALLFGYRIPINFNRPYLARNPSDFWRRWHISLSTWLRDYLFIPLGGSRGGPRRTARNLMITMVLGGLWHGAGWNFVLWGAYWGILLVAYHAVKGRSFTPAGGVAGACSDVVKIGMTFCVVLLGWAFFRVPIEQLGPMLEALVSLPLGARRPMAAMSGEELTFVLAVASAYFAWVGIGERLWQSLPVQRAPIRGVAYAMLLVLAVVAAPMEKIPFIYFQF